jgi:hypothetical protein
VYFQKTVYFIGIEPDAIDSFFDSVQLHKIVALELEADESVVSSVVSRCCEQMQVLLPSVLSSHLIASLENIGRRVCHREY